MFSQVTRIGEVKTSIDNTTVQRSLFLDSSIFFFNSTPIFFDSNFKISTCVFFLFVNIYFANLDSYFLLHSMYFTSFDFVFTIGIILSATERHRVGDTNTNVLECFCRLEVCSHVKDRILVESDTFVPFVSKNVVSVSEISAVIEFDCRMEVVCL